MSMNLTLTLPNKKRIDLFQMNTLETNAVLAAGNTEAQAQRYLFFVRTNCVQVAVLPTENHIIDWFRQNPYKGTPEFIQDMREFGSTYRELQPSIQRFDSFQMYYSTEQRVLAAVADGAVFGKQ